MMPTARKQGIKPSVVADGIPWDTLAVVSSELAVGETVLTYRRELQERAAAGDTNAASVLEGKPNDEPIDT